LEPRTSTRPICPSKASLIVMRCQSFFPLSWPHTLSSWSWRRSLHSLRMFPPRSGTILAGTSLGGTQLTLGVPSAAAWAHSTQISNMGSALTTTDAMPISARTSQTLFALPISNAMFFAVTIGSTLPSFLVVGYLRRLLLPRYR
jgi:hypothetical protein